MSWWIVTGRIPYDDEDTMLIIEATDATEAQRTFVTQLLELGDNDPDDRRDETEKEEGAVILNYIVACGDVEPQIVMNNA